MYLVGTVSLFIVIYSLFVLVMGRPIFRYFSTRVRDRGRKAFRTFRSSAAEAITRPFEFFMNTLSM